MDVFLYVIKESAVVCIEATVYLIGLKKQCVCGYSQAARGYSAELT